MTTTLAKPGPGLAEQVAKRMSATLLPGDIKFTDEALAAAADFMLATAQSRKPAEPAIALESIAEGQAGRMLRIAIANDDMPFLVDSVAAAIASEGLVVDRLVHPVLSVRRDEKGTITELPEGGGAGEKRESWIYLETDRVDAKHRRDLEQALEQTLADVRAGVEDWPKMRSLMMEDADRVPDAEGAALMRWMAEGMLTQLGHVTRKRDGSQSNLLGICRKSARNLLADSTYERAFAWFDGGAKGETGRAPLVIKANRLSLVHRRAPLDLFIVPLMEDGRVAALSIHAGIWTSAALNTPPTEVPRLRAQLADLTKKLGLAPESHDGKSLQHALTVLPHDLVSGFTVDDIERAATAMMALVDRPRPRLLLIEAPLERHVFAFAWFPRDQVSTSVRRQVTELLKRHCNCEVLDWGLEVEGNNLALLRFVLDIRESGSIEDPALLDREFQAMLRGWTEAVESELAQNSDEPGRAAALAAHYAPGFPMPYRSAYGPTEAANDIGRLRFLDLHEGSTTGRRDTRLYRHGADPADQLRLKVYQTGGSLPLSDAVPVLEHFGFRVLSEIPTVLEGEHPATIHDFSLGLPESCDAEQLVARAEAIEQAIADVLNGQSENDVFNRLIVCSALAAQEAVWLRAFYRYLRQTGMSYTIYTVCDALANAPAVTRGLIALFRARHDPAFSGDAEAAVAEAEDAIREGLAGVAAINDDRLLRRYHAVIGAILRTNAFAPAGDEALAFKIDSASVPNLPKPLPWREIWVYSRRVEGIHLRAGPVARGGIRWSDRRDDFRTEVLGLMKAQRVKNAVIVPTGAKGGFYPKQLPDPRVDRDAWASEGRESYMVYIRALLSITDNIVDDAVVHPDMVTIHDGQDPYFVVAADKGTASFSDTANGIAEAQGFWLGDAFASGGSNGYDHKAMGITARGGWLSVQRHFLEMGVDVQSDPVRVVGVGDMSGDVFGNGMLLSNAIKLVAAFDHRHIFLDPDPDPESSWAERKRLFELPRSSWEDYDQALISKGGGVFPRSLKRIPLSDEIRTMLGVDAQDLDPESLMNAILKAESDLLWFGGIGTYVKGAAENNIDVGDRANDGLRIDGRDVGAKVIGEGANLGVTQAGRIEFALHGAKGAGGRINTDFIDNSAGVDCSDNEVNIKIALAAARTAGRLAEDRRVSLLKEMTDEVAGIVLEDNRLQALCLSIAEAGGPAAIPSYIRTIEILEDRGGLDRHNEGLADDETLNRRASDGKGMTRPELAVLLSNTKLVLQDAIEESTLDTSEAMEPLLLDAFPEQVSGEFRKQVFGHRLRGELVATKLANRIVNRLGMVHPFELAEEEGVGLDQIAAAFSCAEQLFGLDDIWIRLETAEMPETARIALFDRLALATRIHIADLLRIGAGAQSPEEVVAELSGPISELSTRVGGLLGEEATSHSVRIRNELAESGAPEDVITMVTSLFDLDGSTGLARLAVSSGVSPEKLATAFTDLGARMGLDWAQSRASVMAPSDPWERLLVAGLARDFQQMRLEFLSTLVGTRNGKRDPQKLVEEWSDQKAKQLGHFREMIDRAHKAVTLSPAMLAQIAGQARNLLRA